MHGACNYIILHCYSYLWVDLLSVSDVYRFTAEEKAKRPQLCHLPFGFGPRSCIGMRFALLEAKMALIELLKRYTFVKAPDTEVMNCTIIILMLNSNNH